MPIARILKTVTFEEQNFGLLLDTVEISSRKIRRRMGSLTLKLLAVSVDFEQVMFKNVAGILNYLNSSAS